jgi:N-acetylneuraminic acid mutarotase
MIIWGGLDSNGAPINTGAKYNPTTDTWTAVPTTNAPSARSYHVAVWTGTEMIIWGGQSNTGSKYDPTTNTWTSMTTVNAPGALSMATAVWTGTEMIVWGGLTNSGGRYNPATNTWTPTPIVNSPSPRFGNAMVWTGTEAIVWGGAGAGVGTDQDSGARYNPSNNTWTAMSKTNAPSPRVFPSGIWDGTEMIVWGGGPNSSGALTNTGAKYIPSTDTWVPISNSNAPSIRYKHTAVWTGSEMIVWGGVDNNNNVNNGYLNTGGRYKPSTDTWTSSCATNAPAKRVSFSSIWTGREMLLWGGSNPTRLNTGGRYSIPNQIDDAAFFVKQQYLDFLNRQPDQSGWDFWTNNITSCGSDAQCIEVKRINVSAAFFLSIEFQQTGNLVYKMYKAGFGNLPGKPVAVDRGPFMTDTRQIQSTPGQVIVNQGNWQAQLETNKQAFALAFVQRSVFQAAHATQPADQYVSDLFSKTGVTPTAAETAAAVNAFNSAGGGDAGRAAALRSVAESASVAAKLNNEAFVLMQYFGYLQRNPYDPPELTLDYQGYNFWLGKLNQFNGDFAAAEMVKAFISSSEYRQRFGP